MRRLTATCALVGVCLVFAHEHAGAEVYRDLVGGDDSARAAAALTILRDADNQSPSLVRRAIFVATVVPRAKHLPPLTNIVTQDDLTAATRAYAALALGIIGHEHPDLWPPGNGKPRVHQPLPVFAKNALASCLSAGPVTLRRACAEAVGMAGLSENTDELRQILEDEVEDDLLRIAAGRALTRITGQLTAPDPETLGQ